MLKNPKLPSITLSFSISISIYIRPFQTGTVSFCRSKACNTAVLNRTLMSSDSLHEIAKNVAESTFQTVLHQFQRSFEEEVLNLIQNFTSTFLCDKLVWVKKRPDIQKFAVSKKVHRFYTILVKLDENNLIIKQSC